MAAAAILNFGKMSITLDWLKDILHQIIWEDAAGRRGDDHVTKSQNRKSISVTSSNKGLKQMCVDLSDYNRQPYEGRLPLTSWWRKSSNMTVGQSSLIYLAHH